MSKAPRVTNLAPISGKSFGGKATVVQFDNEDNQMVDSLFSYDTEVASYNHHTNAMTVKGWYSSTTARHINAFLFLHNFDTCSKSQLIKRYNLTSNI